MSTRQTKVAIPTWDLSDRLAKSLRVAELSVQDMADYLGVSRNTISNYTHGRTVPDKRTMMLWAMRCGVPLEWLESGSEHDSGGGGPHISGYAVGQPSTAA